MLPDEHRIFQASEHAIRRSLPRNLMHDRAIKEFGAWAVADNSGDTPDTTDDGILWLYMSKSIMLGNDSGSPRVPVMAPDGSEHVIVTNAATLFVLSDMFRWTMNCDGKMYRAVRW